MLDRISNVQKIIIQGFVIVIIAIVTLWVGFSAFGNWQIGQRTLALEPPSASKARYQFDVAATRQTYLTNDYTEPSTGVYQLNGYYYLSDGKWVYSKSVLNLDTYYWGPVTERVR